MVKIKRQEMKLDVVGSIQVGLLFIIIPTTCVFVFFFQIYGPFEFLEFINRGENVLKKMKAMIFAKN